MNKDKVITITPNKNRNNFRNVRLFALNNGNRNGFNIFLDFSGNREFLIYHRHNGQLYERLKDGISLGQLRRWCGSSHPLQNSRHTKCSSKRTQVYRSMNYILRVTDNYLINRNRNFAAQQDCSDTMSVEAVS